VADKTPLRFEFDSTTPSSLAEFTSSDTVPLINGGTGVSSLSNFGTSLSATPVLAASISATTVSSTAFTGGSITGDSASATAVSGVTFNGMSYPPPFGYAQLDSDGTGTAALQNLGVGATIASIVSDSDDITWNDTNKNFEVSSAGVYELTSIVLLGVGGTTNVTIKAMKKRGIVTSVENTVDSRVHSSIDPTETTIRAVANCLAADVLYITTVDDNTDVVTAITGSSIMVKRLK